jgi:hypothetical protein
LDALQQSVGHDIREGWLTAYTADATKMWPSMGKPGYCQVKFCKKREKYQQIFPLYPKLQKYFQKCLKIAPKCH